MNIKFKIVKTLQDKAMVRYMDAECFPEDQPFEWSKAHFFIGEFFENGSFIQPACYCAWKRVTVSTAFLYRAGVMHNFRGSGLQKEMIILREKDMLRKGYAISVTCTEMTNMPSMYSLMNCGYKPYSPEDINGKLYLPNVSYDVPSVHWYKKLA